MVKAIYEQLGPYLGMTLREFEVGFMRDACPEREIWLWVRITNAWLDYHVQHLNSALLAPDKEEELVTALIHISCGCIHITNISGGAEAGKRLVDCYRKTASN